MEINRCHFLLVGKFIWSKVEENIKIGISFVGTGENNTILVEAEKITMKEHSDRDKVTASSSFEDLHVERRNFTSKITLGTDKMITKMISELRSLSGRIDMIRSRQVSSKALMLFYYS